MSFILQLIVVIHIVRRDVNMSVSVHATQTPILVCIYHTGFKPKIKYLCSLQNSSSKILSISLIMHVFFRHGDRLFSLSPCTSCTALLEPKAGWKSNWDFWYYYYLSASPTCLCLFWIVVAFVCVHVIVRIIYCNTINLFSVIFVRGSRFPIFICPYQHSVCIFFWPCFQPSKYWDRPQTLGSPPPWAFVVWCAAGADAEEHSY